MGARKHAHWMTSRIDMSLPVMWGSPVTAVQLRVAEAANARKDHRARQEAIAHSMNRATTARLLGLSERAATRRIEVGQIVGFKVGRRWAVPSWLVDTDKRELIPAVEMVQARFPGGRLRGAAGSSDPPPELAGRSPREMRATRQVAEVLRVASTLTGLQ